MKNSNITYLFIILAFLGAGSLLFIFAPDRNKNTEEKQKVGVEELFDTNTSIITDSPVTSIVSSETSVEVVEEQTEDDMFDENSVIINGEPFTSTEAEEMGYDKTQEYTGVHAGEDGTFNTVLYPIHTYFSPYPVNGYLHEDVPTILFNKIINLPHEELIPWLVNDFGLKEDAYLIYLGSSHSEKNGIFTVTYILTSEDKYDEWMNNEGKDFSIIENEKRIYIYYEDWTARTWFDSTLNNY